MRSVALVSVILAITACLLMATAAAATPSSVGGNVFSKINYTPEKSGTSWSFFPSSSTGTSYSSGFLPGLIGRDLHDEWRTRRQPVTPPDPASSPVYLSDLSLTGEYVKVTNQGWEPVTMTGWRISNREGRTIRFIDWRLDDGTLFTYELRGHSTVTIYSGCEGSPSRTRLYWPQEIWNDRGDTAYLYNPENILVSSLSGEP
ncbi:MAG: lamin tail domain-containing protein [Methanomicrobiales archaeon]|nr:lamin tail domain-containing protein [Methanomicrobiales archaeon]NYT21631.1 lamin tail domain-containing protein [Methanomicrobiales archaeon]